MGEVRAVARGCYKALAATRAHVCSCTPKGGRHGSRGHVCWLSDTALNTRGRVLGQALQARQTLRALQTDCAQAPETGLTDNPAARTNLNQAMAKRHATCPTLSEARSAPRPDFPPRETLSGLPAAFGMTSSRSRTRRLISKGRRGELAIRCKGVDPAPRQ